MTNEQRERIAAIRQNGCGYTTIAIVIGFTKGNVKACCRKHNLAGIKGKATCILHRSRTLRTEEYL